MLVSKLSLLHGVCKVSVVLNYIIAIIIIIIIIKVDSVQTFDSLSCRARGKQNKQCSCMIYTCIYYIYIFIYHCSIIEGCK